MDFLTYGCIKAVLEKYADPIVTGIKSVARDEWEKFKVDFDVVFIDYINNAYNKYSKIKTLLYRTEPKYIYDFFEVPVLKKGYDKFIKADTTDDILNVSRHVIITGTGGIGKSTLMSICLLMNWKKKI